MARSDPESAVHTTLVRASARAWGIATGLILGGGLTAATLVLVAKGGPDKGAHLGRLGQIFPGYEVSATGSLIGFVYAFVVGYALGRLLAPRTPLSIERLEAERGKHVRLNAGAWGATSGAIFALILFATTNVLALRGGEHPGELLGHAAIYFPGYSVTFAGSLIGAAYAFGAAYLLGRLIAAVYNRTVESAERATIARGTRAASR
jgi:hypothetical protein